MRQANARAAGKRGFTLIELLVVVAIIALLISILMPSLARARELSKRTVCASNVKGIGLGFASYAAANNDNWPIPNHPSTNGNFVNYMRAIGAKRGAVGIGKEGFGETGDGTTFSGITQTIDTYQSTTRAFWMLVRGGNTPKSFVCPSATTDSPNLEDNPQSYWDFGSGDSGIPTNPGTGGPIQSSGGVASSVQLGVDIAKIGWQQVSYGYQIPFTSPDGKYGTPGPNVDPDMALVSDKGPFSASNEGGQGTPGAGYEQAGYPDANSSPEDWKRYNSPNHGGYKDGEGQNVMYSDGHVEFFTSPTCGVSKDNIFTQTNANVGDTNASMFNKSHGIEPKNLSAPIYPRNNNDSLIYP